MQASHARPVVTDVQIIPAQETPVYFLHGSSLADEMERVEEEEEFNPDHCIKLFSSNLPSNSTNPNTEQPTITEQNLRSLPLSSSSSSSSEIRTPKNIIISEIENDDVELHTDTPCATSEDEPTTANTCKRQYIDISNEENINTNYNKPKTHEESTPQEIPPNNLKKIKKRTL